MVNKDIKSWTIKKRKKSDYDTVKQWVFNIQKIPYVASISQMPRRGWSVSIFESTRMGRITNWEPLMENKQPNQRDPLESLVELFNEFVDEQGGKGDATREDFENAEIK